MPASSVRGPLSAATCRVRLGHQTVLPAQQILEAVDTNILPTFRRHRRTSCGLGSICVIGAERCCWTTLSTTSSPFRGQITKCSAASRADPLAVSVISAASPAHPLAVSAVSLGGPASRTSWLDSDERQVVGVDVDHLGGGLGFRCGQGLLRFLHPIGQVLFDGAR
jgi:hypothetical protein